MQALERGYQESGRARPRWNAQVHTAFRLYAEVSRGGHLERWDAMKKAVRDAVATGCEDPMLAYLRARYLVDDGATGAEEIALAYLHAQQALLTSPYHPLFKFFTGWRAVEATHRADRAARLTTRSTDTTASLEDLARDTNAPPDEVFDSAWSWADVSHYNRNWLEPVMQHLQGLLQRNWGGQERCVRFLGWVEIQRAWIARGTGFANTVRPGGWKDFQTHLGRADALLRQAWGMNSNVAQTAVLMMEVQLGQEHGRDREEAWFQRAMAVDTNCYGAAWSMVWYLEPRWYGSAEEELAFGRECVASTRWGGRVPLVLVDAHHSLATYYGKAESPDYWHQPQVWRDVQSAYEKFFHLNPGAASWRPNYARDAFLCGHYAEFLAQAKRFGSTTNFDFFGGEAKFRTMLAQATARAGRE